MRVITAPDGTNFVLADRGIIELTMRTPEDVKNFDRQVKNCTTREELQEVVKAVIVRIHSL